MFPKYRVFLAAVILIFLGLACGIVTTAPVGVNNEPGNYAEEYDDSAEEPEVIPPPSTLSPPTMTPLATPTAQVIAPQPTSTTTSGVFIPVTGGGENMEATPIVISMDLNTVFTEVVASLPQGSALFNPPEAMRLGEPYTVEVRVVPITEEEIEENEEVIATLTTDLEGEQEVIVIPLRVSTVMGAKLTGEAFEIVPHMEEEQIRMPDAPYLRWLWEVTPQKTGEQRLTLTLTVVVNAEGVGEKPHVTTEVRKVQVSGNPVYSFSRFMGSNWEFVVTGLLFPAVGWGWKKMRDRRKAGIG